MISKDRNGYLFLTSKDQRLKKIYTSSPSSSSFKTNIKQLTMGYVPRRVKRRRCLRFVAILLALVALSYVYYATHLGDNQKHNTHRSHEDALDDDVQKPQPHVVVDHIGEKVATVARTQVEDDHGGDRAMKTIAKAPKGDEKSKANTNNDEFQQEVDKILAKVPKTFLPEYRNPCWHGDADALTCLPYFYVIGMPKCGTTDLWNKLGNHPEIIPTPKEPHWWGPRRMGYTGTAVNGNEVLKVRKMTGDKDDSSINWYLNWYKLFAVSEVRQGVKPAPDGADFYPRVFGDMSISTAYDIGDAWTERAHNGKGPTYTNADLLHAAQPKAKIIMMLRNPSEQVRSWFYYTHPYKGEDDFHQYVQDSLACFKQCAVVHNGRYCAYSFGCPYKTFQGFNVGLYYIYVKDWIDAYTREGVLILRLEDWHANQVAVFKQIVEFLELRQLTRLEERKVKTRWTQVSQKTMRDDTRKLVDDFFQPFNKKLAQLLGDDRFLFS